MDISQKRQDEIMLRDNASLGSNDMDMLGNMFDIEYLTSLGVFDNEEKSSSTNQISLSYNAERYEQVKKALDSLKEEFDVKSRGEVVWLLLENRLNNDS
jgi:hypothetical protein